MVKVNANYFIMEVNIYKCGIKEGQTIVLPY